MLRRLFLLDWLFDRRTLLKQVQCRRGCTLQLVIRGKVADLSSRERRAVDQIVSIMDSI
jgi:hypothetical protein